MKRNNFFRGLTFSCVITFSFVITAYSQSNVVPDNVEFAVLKEIWDTMGGSTWTTKTNWPISGSWPVSATATQMDTWYGITVTNGDITGISLSKNKLTGAIPVSIQNLSSLTSLVIDQNTLTGSLPAQLGNLSKLITLNVSTCALTGAIPTSIFELKNLKSLTISSNNFSSPLPANIGNCSALQTLLASNTKLTGTIPPSLNNLTNLTNLQLWRNSLTGQIPDVSSLTKLVTLRLEENQLTGSIPNSIGNLTELTSLYLNTNLLSGNIPSSIVSLTKLQYLQLHENALSGSIPSEIGNLTELIKLLLYDNSFTGPLSASIGNLIKLQYLYLYNNKLTGELPSTLANLKQLVYLKCDANRFTGVIGSWIGGLSNLGTLTLNTNNFSGDFPSAISSCTSLTYINASDNSFTSIPATVMNLPALTYLNFNRNQLKSIPDLASHTNKANLSAYVTENYLDFSQLEPVYNSSGVALLKGFSCSPQKKFDQISKIHVPLNENLVIPGAKRGQYGTVTWEKKTGTNTWTNVNTLDADATLNTYQINGATAAANGVYRWTMTNSRVTTVTLQSIEIEVSCVDALAGNTTNALYNGMIGAVQWRTDEPLNSGTGNFSGAFSYGYDEEYQLKESNWRNVASVQSMTNTFRVTGLSYDANGNILSLKRYDANAYRVNDFTYSYAANKNQLTSVNGYADSYAYNLIGQMTAADKKDTDDQYVDYDIAGRVIKVYSNPGKTQQKTEYVYDERGQRMAKKEYSAIGSAAKLVKTIWYIRDFSGSITSILEEQADQPGKYVQKEIPLYGAAKLGTYYPGEDGSVGYEIADHLGNVRAVVRESVSHYTATMEDNGQADITNPRVQEMQFFHNLFETEKQDVNMNHTAPIPGVVPDPNRSAFLFWQSGVAGMDAKDKSIGPNTMLKVNTGDKITMETWVRYERKETYTDNLGIALLSQLLGADFAFSGGFEGYTVSQATSNLQNVLQNAAFFGDAPDPARPFAFLNYIIYDQNMNAVDGGWQQIPESAGFSPGEEGLPDLHQRTSIDPVTITQKGYIYIWLSNESENTKVWFDDLKISHTTAFVAQATDYGAWGDIIRQADASVGTPYAAPLDKSLIAQYLFNSNASDDSGHGLHGTINGATLTPDKNGNANAAYSFDGNDHISVPGSEDDLSFIQNKGVFTIAAFVKFSDLNARNVICGNTTTSAQKGFYLMYENSGGTLRKLRFISAVAGSGYNNAFGAQYTINDNNWHHVAAVGDGKVITFFVDGLRDGTETVLNYFGAGNSTYGLMIGGLPDTNGNPTMRLNGSLDNLQIFNRALTAAEIKMLMQEKSVREIDDLLQPQYAYRYGYQGKFSEKDQETGWNHFDLREYDPMIGRWMVPDPKRQHWSPYEAMSNNAVNFIDADGSKDRKPKTPDTPGKQGDIANVDGNDFYWDSGEWVPLLNDAIVNAKLSPNELLQIFGRPIEMDGSFRDKRPFSENVFRNERNDRLLRRHGVSFRASGGGDYYNTDGIADGYYDISILWDAGLIDSDLFDWAEMANKLRVKVENTHVDSHPAIVVTIPIEKGLYLTRYGFDEIVTMRTLTIDSSTGELLNSDTTSFSLYYLRETSIKDHQ